MIEPPLEGTKVPEYVVERKHNLIGGEDYLKFYVPPLQVTIFLDTDLILEIPSGVALPTSNPEDSTCSRELASGEKIPLKCD